MSCPFTMRMNILSWNVRGLESSEKECVMDFCSYWKVEMLVLQ